MIIFDAAGQDVSRGVSELTPPGRIFQSRLPNVATVLTTVSGTAYFVYLGFSTSSLVVKFVEFYVSTAGVGGQTAEVGLFSTANPPNKTNQGTNGIYKLTASATVDSLTTTGVKRNTTAFNAGNGYVTPIGTHLWAGVRIAMATTQPMLASLCMDYGQGLILSTTSAATFTGVGPWTGALIAIGPYLSAPLAPDLRVTLD